MKKITRQQKVTAVEVIRSRRKVLSSSYSGRWFLAEIVVAVHNKTQATCKLNINLVIIEAESEEAAYLKAIEEGRMHSVTLESALGDLIHAEYVGLKNLHYIYDDEIGHGTEILYEELSDCSEESLPVVLKAKSEMNVFRR